MKEMFVILLSQLLIFSLSLGVDWKKTFFSNKKSEIFTNSTHDVDYFLQSYNKTEYDNLCSKYSKKCLKFLNQYKVKFYENFEENEDVEGINTQNNLSNQYIYTVQKYNDYMAEILYKLSEFKYFGLFNDSPNVKEGIKGFIISSYFGNSFAQYKISLLLENNIISIFYSSIQSDINFDEFEQGNEPYLHKEDLLLAYILIYKNYLNNFDFKDNLEKNSLSLTLLYLSSSQNSYAKLALGNKYYRGIGVQKNLDIAINYYREEAYKTVEYHNRINRPNYIEKINLISKEYMSFKYSSKEVGSVDDIIEYYKLEAKKGLISYILNLGKRYLFGQDVNQDFKQSFHYFEYGASLNDTNCKYFLGELYLNGWGVETNYTKAYDIFFDTISFPKSANSLGYMYYYGYGVEKDVNRAFDLFQKSIHLEGDSDAYHNMLSLLVENNDNIKVDFNTAYKYGNILASSAHTFGTYMFAALNDYQLGVGIKSNIITVEFYKAVAERNTLILAKTKEAYKQYMNGNIKGAALMYLELASEGHQYSDINTGILFYNHKIFSNQTYNDFFSYKYFNLKYDLMNLHYNIYLADIYYTGNEFVQQNYEKAFNIYAKLAQKNSMLIDKAILAHSFFNIGIMRYFGLGKDRNVTKFSNSMDRVIQNEPQLYPAVTFIKYLLTTYDSFSLYDVSNSAYERSLSFVMENKIFISATLFYFVFYCYFYISIKRQANE